MAYAKKFKDKYHIMISLSKYADYLHQSGESEKAQIFFVEAEAIHQELYPQYSTLFLEPGFKFCELLLAQKKAAEVIDRTVVSLKVSERGKWPLNIALDKLTFGRAYTQQENLLQATHYLNQADINLRTAGQLQHLPHGLLAQATLHRTIGDFAHARQDLQEVFDIAEPSGMRLHLTDYHLEMARLLLAEAGFDSTSAPLSASAQPSDSTPNNNSGTTRCLSGVEGNIEQARTHVTAAAKPTGYHRRDKELAELQQQIASF